MMTSNIIENIKGYLFLAFAYSMVVLTAIASAFVVLMSFFFVLILIPFKRLKKNEKRT